MTLAGLPKALFGDLVKPWGASDCLSGRTSEREALVLDAPAPRPGHGREYGGGEGSARKCRLLIAPAFPIEQLLPV